MRAETYNAVVESSRGSYRWWRDHNNRNTDRYLSMYGHELYRMLTGVRADHREWAALPVKAGRGVICRSGRARRCFYDLYREGETA